MGTLTHETGSAEFIYESDDKIIYYYDDEIFLIKSQKVKKLSFQRFIREIDICPDKSPLWKRQQILKVAEKVGMFACTK